ncbi:AAA family ATPase [Nocardiopsis alba]|uniref:AAA family ATPase n=1 Tax=Nocardiopsis alba TaxID=53437 RepID=UPI0033EA256B
MASLMAGLDAMVGMSDVKDALSGRLAGLLTAGRAGGGPSRHLVFLGERGTGRTTVAGIYAELLAALGLTSRGRPVRLRAGELVERGEVSRRAREAFDLAHGGVLLITDAHDVVGEEEAAGALVELMGEHHDDVVVVLCGAEEGARAFLSDHPDLEARFGAVVGFSSYTDEELLRIFVGVAEEVDLAVPERTRAVVAEAIEACSERFAAGNGHEVRALFQACAARQARRIEGWVRSGRVLDLEELQTLLPEDVPGEDGAGSALAE